MSKAAINKIQSEIDGKTLRDAVQMVARATDINDHNGAIVLMAHYVARKHNRLEGVDMLVKAAESLQILHKFYGHMPRNLNDIRDNVAARCESFMTEEEKKAFHDAR